MGFVRVPDNPSQHSGILSFSGVGRTPRNGLRCVGTRSDCPPGFPQRPSAPGTPSPSLAWVVPFTRRADAIPLLAELGLSVPSRGAPGNSAPGTPSPSSACVRRQNKKGRTTPPPLDFVCCQATAVDHASFRRKNARPLRLRPSSATVRPPSGTAAVPVISTRNALN